MSTVKIKKLEAIVSQTKLFSRAVDELRGKYLIPKDHELKAWQTINRAQALVLTKIEALDE